MPLACDLDLLEVAVGTGMKTGPVDGLGVGVVPLERKAGVKVFRVKLMSRADATEIADRAAEVHVVPGHQQSSPLRRNAEIDSHSSGVRPAPVSTAKSHISSKSLW